MKLVLFTIPPVVIPEQHDMPPSRPSRENGLELEYRDPVFKVNCLFFICSLQIRLPSGAQINIHEFYWGISIYLSVTDLGEGLCRGAVAATQETIIRYLETFIIRDIFGSSQGRRFDSCLRAYSSIFRSCPG